MRRYLSHFGDETDNFVGHLTAAVDGRSTTTSSPRTRRQEPHSLLVKTSTGNVEFVLSEAATFPDGLKAGDAVTIDYAVDTTGIHWAKTVSRGAAGNRASSKKSQ